MSLSEINSIIENIADNWVEIFSVSDDADKRCMMGVYSIYGFIYSYVSSKQKYLLYDIPFSSESVFLIVKERAKDEIFKYISSQYDDVT